MITKNYPYGTIRLERVKGFFPRDIWWELGTYQNQMEKSMADHHNFEDYVKNKGID